MKCPKCGFNSFEFYDKCKKCSCDLIGFKQTYSIASMVLPLEAKENLAAKYMSADSGVDHISETAETENDIFSFNLPEDTSSPTSNFSNDPFNFNEPSPDVKDVNGSELANDAFADLLESTPQTDESPFGAQGDAASAPQLAKSEVPSAGPGEFDLESFSWDDTTAAATQPDGNDTPDDFDSLFGDTEKNPQK